MGTKNNPGQFDCHANAGDDEPIFTLRSTDSMGAALVELWAHLRSGDIYHAVFCFGWLVANARNLPPPDGAKVTEAYHCAADMRAWHEAYKTPTPAHEQH